MEVIRLDEEPVSKTGGGVIPFVGSSPTASAVSTQLSTQHVLGNEMLQKCFNEALGIA